MAARNRRARQSSSPHIATRHHRRIHSPAGRSESAAAADGLRELPPVEPTRPPLRDHAGRCSELDAAVSGIRELVTDPQLPLIRRLRELMGLMTAFRCGSDGHASVASATPTELNQTGLGAEDLDDLLQTGLLAHHHVSLIELTDAGAALLRRTSQFVDSTLGITPSASLLLPSWRAGKRELWYGDVLVKRMRRAAPNQQLVLAAFEEEGWPARIDDPLPRDYEHVPAIRLHNTVNRLNSHMQTAAIRFGGDGTASGICWHAR
jgi:hypothetical protein